MACANASSSWGKLGLASENSTSKPTALASDKWGSSSACLVRRQGQKPSCAMLSSSIAIMAILDGVVALGCKRIAQSYNTLSNCCRRSSWRKLVPSILSVTKVSSISHHWRLSCRVNNAYVVKAESVPSGCMVLVLGQCQGQAIIGEYALAITTD